MASELIVIDMCEGCGWPRRNSTCRIIKEPSWFFEHRNGKCFAKTTPERAKQIEAEIAKAGKKWSR